jgi:adenosyl cobinamide kinase/adenosyl cobinamide phosphate guanylyltransferase
MPRNRKTTERQPHPDPRTEAELQRIISLRLSVARKEGLIERDLLEIDKLRTTYRQKANWSSSERWRQQADELSAEVQRLEAEVVAAHEEIGKRIDELSPADRSYL